MATQYAFGKITTNGLTLALDATDINSYSSGSTVWVDVSGNGNNGTLINGPTFNSGSIKNFSFDGTNDYIKSSYIGSDTGNYTFSVWSTTSTVADKVPFGRGRDGSGTGWSVAISFLATGQFSVSVVAGSQINATGGSYSTNKWYNITGVWESGVSLSLYVDGVFITKTTTAATTLRSSTDGWGLGSLTTTLFYNVQSSNARVYNRVLSASEILQNYNAHKARFGR